MHAAEIADTGNTRTGGKDAGGGNVLRTARL
jgi:hypothetical protein